ncbi:hypothetical protein C491_03205 [Natronococcus amylolyticus DSM 10524]|uniref:DUF7974 domain-containing protein n=1 Tax=Natronococcus amylolyticus DSM 10524 TaxID=1227497 RepID=L9XEW2_9EURY|nr:hypothetical protein [Natronococcus amylolyticus]ELY60269.1 hypothetical protein C491_03205 [Natronococcus amylolyticus DSM 10524]
MRRIYESSALRRDDDEPFSPRERETEPQSMRSIDSTSLSRRLVPDRLCHWAISIDVSTPRSTYPAGVAIPFRVTMRNAMPFPITVRTRSPILWRWSVDGLVDAAEIPVHDPPAEPQGFRFDRGERKQFTKRWHQHFRVADDEWEAAEPGTHTIGAGLNVADADEKGLYDETTITVEPDDA